MVKSFQLMTLIPTWHFIVASTYNVIDGRNENTQFYEWGWKCKSCTRLTIFDGKLTRNERLDSYQFAVMENDKLALKASKSWLTDEGILELWQMSECGADGLDMKAQMSVKGIKVLPGRKVALVSRGKVKICSENLEPLYELEIDSSPFWKFCIEDISNELVFYTRIDGMIIYNFEKGEVVKRTQKPSFQSFTTWDSKFLSEVADGLRTFNSCFE